MELEERYLLPQEERTFRASAAALMKNVYAWMTLGLVATALMALVVSSNQMLMNAIFSGRFTFMALCIAEIALVWIFASRIQTMSYSVATAVFFAYSLLNGATLASIFYVYDLGSIVSVFFITAGTFGVTSLIGYITKKDLSGWGHFLIMGLIGIIIASLVNMFMRNGIVSYVISLISVVLFVGLTAYDTQNIKRLLINADGYVDDDVKKIALLGALSLYLDFINLFLALLRIFGGSRD